MTYTNISEEQIQDAKLKYGKVQVLTVVVTAAVKDAEGNITTPEESYNVLVIRPSKSVIQLLTSVSNDTDKFFNVAVANLVVPGVGDTDLLEKDGLVYMGFVTQVKNLISPAQSFLSPA